MGNFTWTISWVWETESLFLFSRVSVPFWNGQLFGFGEMTWQTAQLIAETIWWWAMSSIYCVPDLPRSCM